jgi:exonuclease III
LWTISTINVYGLIEATKRNLWFTYLSQSSIDICTHTETNGKNQLTNKWQIPGYTSWWSNNETQKIGSGIGISIKKHIVDYVYKIQTWLGRIISTDLTFAHHRCLRIISIYYPATDQQDKKECDKTINLLIKEANSKQWHIIILGDFNSVPNPHLDKKNITQTNKCQPTSELVKNIMHYQLVDTFHEIFPTTQKFTWSNSREHASRIDQIWINSAPIWLLIDANITEIDNNILPMDYQLMTCIIDTWIITQGQQATRQCSPNNRFNWLNTSTEQWQKFNRMLESLLKNLDHHTENPIDHLWNHIRDSILKAAAEHIKKYNQTRKKPIVAPYNKLAY